MNKTWETSAELTKIGLSPGPERGPTVLIGTPGWGGLTTLPGKGTFVTKLRQGMYMNGHNPQARKEGRWEQNTHSWIKMTMGGILSNKAKYGREEEWETYGVGFRKPSTADFWELASRFQVTDIQRLHCLSSEKLRYGYKKCCKGTLPRTGSINGPVRKKLERS